MDDSYDAYTTKEYHFWTEQILEEILLELHPDTEDDYIDEFAYLTFEKMLGLRTHQQFKAFKKQIKKHYKAVIKKGYSPPNDTWLLPDVHLLLRSQSRPAAEYLEAQRQLPAALLLDDELLQMLRLHRLDEIKDVEAAIESLEPGPLAERAHLALERFWRHMRMAWLLGDSVKSQAITTLPSYWGKYYRYDLLVQFADERLKTSPLDDLELSKAVLNRLKKVTHKNATIADLPPTLTDLEALPGIGDATYKAILKALLAFYGIWLFNASGIDPDTYPEQKAQRKAQHQAAANALQALEDLDKSFK